jgi:hypothetical protein
LQPKRGEEKETIFPAMGYLHIDGKGMQAMVEVVITTLKLRR